MELILIQNVRNLGKTGDKVDVAPGYGRNWLFPQKLAIPYTEANAKKMAQSRHEIEEKSRIAMEEAGKLCNLLSNKEYIFLKQASDDGRLFGSVTKKEIAKRITDTIGHKVEPSAVIMHYPVKLIGIHPVMIHLYLGVDATIFINIAKSENEALYQSQKKASTLENAAPAQEVA